MTPAAISRMLQARIAAHMESVLGYPVWQEPRSDGEASAPTGG